MHSVNVNPADGAVSMPQNIKLDGSNCAECGKPLPIGVPCIFVRYPKGATFPHKRYHGRCAPLWTLLSETQAPGANVK